MDEPGARLRKGRAGEEDAEELRRDASAADGGAEAGEGESGGGKRGRGGREIGQEDGGTGSLGVVDVLRVLGGLLLLSAAVSWMVTGESVAWGYRPWWSRGEQVRAWWVRFSALLGLRYMAHMLLGVWAMAALPKLELELWKAS